MRASTLAITVPSLLIASSVALAAMIHGGGRFEWNAFYFWVIVPYIVLLGILVIPLGQTSARAGSVSAVMVLFFTCLLYINAMWFSASSTSGLIFVFAPIYLFVGGLMIWGITWLIFSKGKKHNAA